MQSIEVFRKAEQVRHASTGEVVFAAGDEGDVMYAVLEGSVDIVVDDVVVERVELGGFFGEMALIDQAPRSAAAVAASDCRLAVINREQFEQLIIESPLFGITVMEKMAVRLRRANRHG